MFERSKRSALLVDFDNVASFTGRDLVDRIPSWIAWLEDGEFDPRRTKRRFLEKRVYWNGMNDVHRAPFEAQGFSAFACRSHAKSKTSTADIVIALDAISLIYEKPAIEEIVLMTTDSDFVPVVNRIQEQKSRQAIVLVNESNTSAAIYRDHADMVIGAAALRAAFSYQRPAPRRFRFFSPPSPKRAPVETPAPKTARKESGVFDISLVAEKISATAAQSPGPISRKTALRVLGTVNGFSIKGPQAWLGCGAYEKLLAVLVQQRTDLKLMKYANGGVAIGFQGEKATTPS